MSVPCALLAVWLAAAPADQEVGSGPQPSPTPVSWELEFRFLDPKRIEIQLPGQDRPEVYWYVVYTVVNNTGRSQRFCPTFQIVTADLRVLDTDMGISPLIFDAIAQRHKLTHKYLVHPTKACDVLLTGEDHARESVAIWRQVDLTLNNFTLYVAGLSGETRLVPNPTWDPNQPEVSTVIGPEGRKRELPTNPRNFTLRKTLEIRYTLPGSPSAGFEALPERGETRWVMR